MIKNPSIRAFTLIELLVVISIIGMLSSVVLASLSTAREKGRIAAGITFATHTYRAFGADAALIWKFEDAGTTITDLSGNNVTASLSSAINYTSSPTGNGIIGNNVGLFRSSGNFKFESSPGRGISICFWIKVPPSVSTTKTILNGKDLSSFDVWVVKVLTTGNIEFLDSDGGNVFTSATTFNDSQWHHVCISGRQISAGGGTQEIVIYKDGKVESRQTNDDIYIAQGPYNSVHTITTNPYGISLDEIMLFNSAIETN